jgi:hypothetical protein
LGQLLHQLAANPAAVLVPKIEAYAGLPELKFDYQAWHYTQFLLS